HGPNNFAFASFIDELATSSVDLTCGAYTACVDGQAIRSCAYQIDSMQGKSVTTSEGLWLINPSQRWPNLEGSITNAAALTPHHKGHFRCKKQKKAFEKSVSDILPKAMA